MGGSELNPVTKHREFFGVPGALAMILVLPLVIPLLYFVSNETYCIHGVTVDIEAIKKQIPSTWTQLLGICFHKQSWVLYLSWFSAITALDLTLPGTRMKGTQLRDGTFLTYNINGTAVSSAVVAILAARVFLAKNYYVPELQFVYDHHLQLIAVSIIFSFAMAVAVYACSFVPLTHKNGLGTPERILSINGNSGNPIYDFFIGRELNPRIGAWDIKLFCELRPGLLLWIVIDLACIHHQYHQYGVVTDSILLVSALQAIYVLDCSFYEEGSLTMLDITTDGFGFMLSFGDLAWLPWTYSLQARFLSLPQNHVHLGWLNVLLILALSGLGFYVYNASNAQKSEFRQGRLDHMEYIETKTGTKLLCDGWWSKAQHINYLGDWLIAWAWCLTTGFRSPISYYYVVFVGGLLVHRQMRDDVKCSAKYGEQWEEYKRKVPYKIIPYVY